MRKFLLFTTFTLLTLWATDAAAQFRRPGGPGFFQPRPRTASSLQFETPDTDQEIDLHLAVAQLDGGLILGGRYTHRVTDLIGVEGGVDHDHGNSRHGEKLLAYGDLRWKVATGSTGNVAYVTAGVAAGGGYSFSATPFVGVSGRVACSDPMCLRYDLTMYPAVDNLTERYRLSLGFSIAIR
jgi:hypothetical protein